MVRRTGRDISEAALRGARSAELVGIQASCRTNDANLAGRRRRIRCLPWVCLGLAVGLTSRHAAADAESLIREAFESTKRASTVTDFSAIIDLCARARRAEVDQSQEKYLKSLLAWSHNRRGEVLTEQASEAQKRGATDQAAKFDGQALTDFEMAIQLDPTRWKAWHNRGVSHAIAGKFREALDDFSKVVELNPKYANAWFNRGEIHFDLNQMDDALRDYSEAIRLNSNDAGAYTSRGHAHFRLGKHELAFADYDAAIQHAPQDAIVLANRADAYQNLGKWLPAANDLKKAIELNPQSPRVLQSAAWLMATCPDAGIRNAKEAVAAAERAVQLAGQPDWLQLDTLAAAYANDGRYNEAIAKLKEALQHASGADSAVLQARLQLYQKQQPYRQGQSGKSAAVPTSPKIR